MNKKVAFQLTAYSIALVVLVFSLDKCRCNKKKQPIADTKLEQKKSILNKDHSIINSQLALMNDNAELSAYFNSLPPTDQASAEIKALFTKRKAQINGK